jgi:hypothetical protein
MPSLTGQVVPPPAMNSMQIAAGATIGLLSFVATFAIIAMTINGDRSPSRTIGDTLRGLGKPALKLIGAGLLIYVALFVAVFVAIFALVLVGALITTVTGAKLDPESIPLAIGFMVIVFLPLLWAACRLMPLLGVFVDPAVAPIGVIAGIRRAWALSRGHLGTIIGVSLLYWLAAIVVALPFFIAIYGLNIMAGPPLPRLLFFAVIAPFSLVVSLYGAVATGVIYRQLTDA